ncbi:MAG: endolytic transglycosylase MltG [Tissierellia bacterium]|nr:endolytic transglycosylase MltG [Tissierellia bacterium]
MKNFFEKLKDILYDGIDYIMMVLVIIVVALIINWRLGGLFTNNDMNISSIKSPGEATQGEPNTTDDEIHQEKLEDNKEPDDENPQEKIIKITIPPGSLPSKIGNILEDNGLVEDKNAFVQKAIDLNLETKLKYGEFEISKDSSMEEILDILTK